MLGGLGEDNGRYFFKQLLDSIDYMQQQGISHRDLKLENILVDPNFTLKVADFGFATFNRSSKLSSYRGTFTYMAPEIKEGKKYDGVKVDLFSSAVILFILIRGIFPFREARVEESFYSHIVNKDFEGYWAKVQSESLSPECKDLLQKLFSYKSEERPTLAEVRAHPWMTKAATVSDEDIKQ